MLAESLAADLDDLDAAVGEESSAPVFEHGDTTPDQFFFDGPLVGMVDFDRTCSAESALDPGSLIGHLARHGA